MNAAKVHGGGEVFANISLRFGLRGKYAPCAPMLVGMATDNGRGGYDASSADIASSESASTSVIADPVFCDELVEEEVDEVVNRDGDFRRIITFRRRLFGLRAGSDVQERHCKGDCRGASLANCVPAQYLEQYCRGAV